jgi:hypothetical protein
VSQRTNASCSPVIRLFEPKVPAPVRAWFAERVRPVSDLPFFIAARTIRGMCVNIDPQNVAAPTADRLIAWHAWAWAAIAGVFLVPIWAFPYFPTQDGPAHLANALILRDYVSGDMRVQQFYWVNWHPLPNWSCSALLGGLSCVFPALVAEKLLLSLYVVGFAAAYRYFVGSLCRDAGVLSLAGFLFTFNYCLWMGFYNYCLSLVGYFMILGYLLRHWDPFRARDALVLCALLGLVYLTHLFGFTLAAISCLWIAIAVPPRGWRKSLSVVAVLAPGVALALSFFRAARFAGDGVFRRLGGHLLGWVSGTNQWQRLEDDFLDLDAHLFGIHPDLPVPLGLALGLLCYLFIVAGFCSRETSSSDERARRRAVALLGGVLAILYFLVPDMLVIGKGGYWKGRLAPLPPLLWLACVRLPKIRAVRSALTASTLALLGVNLVLVSAFIQKGNHDLCEFTSGVEAVGRGRVLIFDIGDGRTWRVNLLAHAADYYCLNSGNINLSPHFAMLKHSVVRLRPGLEIKGGAFADDPHLALVDTIVIWDDDSSPVVPAGFALAFRRGRLTVCCRLTESVKSSSMAPNGRQSYAGALLTAPLPRISGTLRTGLKLGQ